MRSFLPRTKAAINATAAVRAAALSSALAVLAAGACARAAPPIELDVDATDVTHGVQHAHLVVPVRPGPLTLGIWVRADGTVQA